LSICPMALPCVDDTCGACMLVAIRTSNRRMDSLLVPHHMRYPNAVVDDLAVYEHSVLLRFLLGHAYELSNPAY